MKTSSLVVAFLFQLPLTTWAAPNPQAVEPEPPPALIKVTFHKLENGEKKSSVSIAALSGGSASTFTIANNKIYERDFINPEVLDNGKVRVRLNECTGTVTDEELKNLSAVNCHPETMSRLTFEASVNQPAIVEATGPNGEKQEYYLFVEKVTDGSPATTL